MKALLDLVSILVRSERKALLRGFALAALVLVMGVALLGLSGWFITAAAAAGMAGIGILFNVFAPSAMVRLLALGRTAARYGERLLTHDATLRALSQLRIRLLRGLLTRPHAALEHLRANTFLNRVTADIDALDGALLRLVLPSVAGWAVIVLSTIALWWLVHPAVALVVGLGYLILPTLVFLAGQRTARRPARQAEAAMQAGRARLIDQIAARDDLVVYGQAQVAAAHSHAAYTRHASAQRALDRIERHTGAALEMVGALVTAGALGVGAYLVQTGDISAARAAIGIFAALALAEAVAPVRRALSEIGRMTLAARRVLPSLQASPGAGSRDDVPETPTMSIDNVSYRARGTERTLFAPVSFCVAPGETVALVGPSGSGKTSLLLMAAGSLTPATGSVRLDDRPVETWSREALARRIALVPQRHALVAGTIEENLRLAAPNADNRDLWQALEAARIAGVIRSRGGLQSRLGFRGAGLSGGEARRLVLARAVLRAPAILLLDEPTEGLDDTTAAEVLSSLRQALPDAAILMAAHRPVEIAAAHQVITLETAGLGHAD